MGQWVKLESTTVLMSQVNSNSALDLFHSQNHRKHGTSLKVQKGKGLLICSWLVASPHTNIHTNQKLVSFHN